MTTRLSELELIQDAMKSTRSTRMIVRYQVILLHLKGYLNTEIAAIIGKCEHTVGKYLKAYRSYSVGGLIPTPPPGAERKLNPEQEQIFIETISTKTPNQVGLAPYKSWNSKLICIWVKSTFQTTYSQGGMRDMLSRLGFSYTKPTYSLAKANPRKQEEFKEYFEILKKN